MRVLRVTSWNINGWKKIASMVKLGILVPFLFHVLLLQETFYTVNKKEKPPALTGYIGFHVEAIVTGGRPSKGLTSFFEANVFSNGTLKVELCPVNWALVVRWLPAGSTSGMVFVNIYIPRHTDGFLIHELELFIRYFSTLRSSLPADDFLIGGDWNADRYRWTASRDPIVK